MVDAYNFDPSEEARKLNLALATMRPDQLAAYNAIKKALDEKTSGLFYIDGPGGSGKTFLEMALLSTVRSRKEIAVPCAWSGVAATLVEGGRTCHSTFGFPVPLPEDDVTSTIAFQSGRAEVLRQCTLIFWDEAPMSPTEAVTGALHIK